MKRVRLSTLLLLVVIAALVIALAMERKRSASLERQIPIITARKIGNTAFITETTLAIEEEKARPGAKK